jgi:nuclear transcription factor Y, gamma
MKADPEVKMISAEAPILFAKGCDIFITELTMRAWIHAEDNKRRTLQRSDIAAALSKSDMFDFLIDIVPREDSTGGAAKRPTTSGQAAAVPQQTMGPPQTDYGMPQHSGMPPPDQSYRQSQGMYGAHMGEGQPDPSRGYGAPGPAMFPGAGDMYNPYGQPQFGGAPQQQVSDDHAL